MPLQHAVAADLAPLVQRLAEGGGGGGRAGRAAAGAAAGAVTVMADSRSNSLIVKAANPARLAESARRHRAAGPAGVGGPGRHASGWCT
jgi:general secretion pathway protein D